MQPYLQLLDNVIKNGKRKSNRTGTDTLQIVGTQSRYDLTKGFPATTTKKLFMKGVIHELIWLLSGDTNIRYLRDNGVNIWNEWADAEGNLGPVYGEMWRRFPGPGDTTTDQISNLIQGLRKDPASRRHIVSAWHAGLVSQQALPPCHTLFQFDVDNDGGLTCHLYQRSADLFLGVPFNIASYSLLTHMVAQVTGLTPKEFVHTIHDAHIYVNHLDQCMLQLEREPLELPKLWLNPDIKEIDDFKYEDIQLLNYKSHSAIKGEVAV